MIASQMLPDSTHIINTVSVIELKDISRDDPSLSFHIDCSEL